MAAFTEQTSPLQTVPFCPSADGVLSIVPSGEALLVDWNEAGRPAPPPEVTAHFGREPTHIVVDGGETIGFVFGAPPDSTLLLPRPPHTSEPCPNGCVPHEPAPCPARRRQTPYPTSAERAISRSSTRSSSNSSPPPLLEVSDSSGSEDGAAAKPAAAVDHVGAARDTLRVTLGNLEIDGMRDRLRKQRAAGMAPLYDPCREILAKESPRGSYPSWPMFDAATDACEMFDAILCFISELLDIEPHFHPEAYPADVFLDLVPPKFGSHNLGGSAPIFGGVQFIPSVRDLQSVFVTITSSMLSSLCAQQGIIWSAGILSCGKKNTRGPVLNLKASRAACTLLYSRARAEFVRSFGPTSELYARCWASSYANCESPFKRPRPHRTIGEFRHLPHTTMLFALPRVAPASTGPSGTRCCGFYRSSRPQQVAMYLVLLELQRYTRARGEPERAGAQYDDRQ